MGGKLTNEGENDALNQYIKRTNLRGADSLYLGLYTDTNEPLETATLASGLTELNKVGYSRIQVLDADWTVTAAEAVAATKRFTAGEDWGNVYGYFITDVPSGTGGLLQFVEHIPPSSGGPFNIANGKTFDLTAKINAEGLDLTDEGRNDILNQWIKRANLRGADSLYLGIYLNTTQPLQTATLASGLTELALTGYARTQITDANWTVTADEAVAALKTFTAGEDWGNTYGYFITDVPSGTGGLLITTDHFSTGPFNVANTKTIDITAKIKAA